VNKHQIVVAKLVDRGEVKLAQEYLKVAGLTSLLFEGVVDPIRPARVVTRALQLAAIAFPTVLAKNVVNILLGAAVFAAFTLGTPVTGAAVAVAAVIVSMTTKVVARGSIMFTRAVLCTQTDALFCAHLKKARKQDNVKNRMLYWLSYVSGMHEEDLAKLERRLRAAYQAGH